LLIKVKLSDHPNDTIVSASYSSAYTFAKKICSQILQLDNSIRYAGVGNNMGTLVTYEFRQGVEPILNEEELQSNTINAVLRMKTREDYESKLGDVVYTFTLYKKVKRASIPLDHPLNLMVLNVSFDIVADHERIILDKILPAIRSQKLTLAET
jgi:hypothetical protein